VRDSPEMLWIVMGIALGLAGIFQILDAFQ
jgi:hypothetical protein